MKDDRLYLIHILECILGREAAYKGRIVSWERMMKANARLDGRFRGLKD